MPIHQLGRKSPKNHPAIQFSDIAKTMPTTPVSADYLKLGGWQMLGNDQYGDCVAVTWANERRLLTYHSGNEKYPNLDATLEFYKTQNPNFPSDDNGMDIQTALEDLVKNGGPDGVKAVAFAKVDHTKVAQVKQALAIFGCLWVGINVYQNNETQFDSGQPWDYTQGSPNLGGHSIIVGGYDSDNKGGDETFVTWAEETSFTDNFWTHCVEETWVVIWPEHLSNPAFLQGVDINALADSYKTLTGKTLPLPTPTPTPTPTPQPTPSPTPTPTPTPSPNPTPDPTDLENAVKAWLQANVTFADALIAWIQKL